jgi:hypothetical protein
VVLASSSEDHISNGSHHLRLREIKPHLVVTVALTVPFIQFLFSVLVIVAPVVVAGVRIPPLVRFKLCHQVVQQSLDPRRARDHDPSNGPICWTKDEERIFDCDTLLIVDQDREMDDLQDPREANVAIGLAPIVAFTGIISQCCPK